MAARSDPPPAALDVADSKLARPAARHRALAELLRRRGLSSAAPSRGSLCSRRCDGLLAGNEVCGKRLQR